jgi:sulfate transport system ATP-binding protein
MIMAAEPGTPAGTLARSADPGPAALEVVGLTRRFTRSGPPAVDAVSFSARPGTITTLLGPSGSGKSTVLRLIAGLEYPDAGRVIIQGVDGTHLPPQRRRVGFVFQSYALFPHLDVRGNIAFGLEIRKLPRAEVDGRIDELLAMVELEGLDRRLPRELSGGQRQRVAFARALATSPHLLLLDEPFGALDAQVRVSLRAWLRRFHEERARSSEHPPVTTLLVTHDQDEAMELADTLVVMNQGRIEQQGDPSTIYDYPVSPFVASFVGGANVLGGRAFVRPHEVKLSRASPASQPGEPADGLSLAQIERFALVGAHVKVTLRLPGAETLTVELGREEWAGLGLLEGDRVLADLQEAKIFLGDYSI